VSLPYDVGAGAYAISRDERRRLRAHVMATVAACHAFESALEAYALV